MGGFTLENHKTFLIGEFSAKTGISIRNLRYYDEIGLLVPEKHPTSGHRMYNDHDIITLQKILSLKFLGYSLEQINGLLHHSSFNVDLNDTLTLHLNALEEQKDKIEKSMTTIKRVIHLINEEGEVESNLLFSLIQGLPTEELQKDWFERHQLMDVVDELSNKSVEESIALDKIFVDLIKNAKQLYGKPIEDQEVQGMIKSFIKEASKLLGEDLIQGLFSINVEEQELQELEKMTPTPFTEKEQKWLSEALDYFQTNTPVTKREGM